MKNHKRMEFLESIRLPEEGQTGKYGEIRRAQGNPIHKRTQEAQGSPIHQSTQEAQGRQLHKQYSQEELELQEEMEKRFDELFGLLDDDEWE